MYSGSFFFYLVFHAIVHPHHSARYVSVNEAVVGLCGFVGPMAGGLLADAKGLAWPYFTAVGLVAVGVLLKLLIHSRFRPHVTNLTKH
jgi:predicted MFS family arabinose efflux permease